LNFPDPFEFPPTPLNFPVLDDAAFDAAAKEVDVELKQLKNILEAI